MPSATVGATSGAAGRAIAASRRPARAPHVPAPPTGRRRGPPALACSRRAGRRARPQPSPAPRRRSAQGTDADAARLRPCWTEDLPIDGLHSLALLIPAELVSDAPSPPGAQARPQVGILAEPEYRG